MQYRGSFPRDANFIPDTASGCLSTDIQTLVGNNTAVVVPIFGITGTVEVRGLWGVVTTALGANNTAASWRLNDQTAQVAITAVAGTALSAVAAGSTIVKKGVAATALTLLDNAAGRVSEPSILETLYFSPFVVMKKTAATTNIEFLYTTTDTPTSGVIQFFLRWVPLSADAQILSL